MNSKIVQADYKEQVIKEYQGNPLIEALPEICSKEKVVSHLASYPFFTEVERELDSHFRFHVIQRVFQYFQPLPIHLDLESRISRLVRQGYINRNPLQVEYVKSFVDGRKDIEAHEITSHTCDNSSGLTIVGTSGMGKTATMTKILNTMPQVIVHSHYKGQHFVLSQIVWLKLECPYDGSIKGLCLNFLMEVDRLLNTNYYKVYGKNGRLSANSLLPVIAQIARNTALSLLVIDEIQHLSLARSGGAEKMLNFFVTLQNAIGIPVILIGTPKSLSILQTEFRQARRSSGKQGDVIWNQLKKEDKSWELFINGLWKYQWVKYPTNLSGEMNDVMFQESQGIIDIAKKLFAMAQIRAITSGIETISPKVIKEVAKENFKLIQPMLQALKTNNHKKILQYGDISPISFDQFYATEQSKLQLEQTAKWIEQEQQTNQFNIEQIKSEVIVRLTLLGIEKDEAIKAVKQYVTEADVNKNLGEVVKKVYQGLVNNVAKEQVNPEVNTDFDLRQLIKEGKEKGLTAYIALKKANFIKQDFEWGGG
ncbi:ATP-binding protein [Alkalihalobacterium bogoriense]|uniref:ATP-binding protein n=1 Tax=Alkalihalobacterium bogoriense TaxID=246272 RepID=UPI00047DB55A|nr:ATP-binding protein [Alkalihalobacterium bogoriense]